MKKSLILGISVCIVFLLIFLIKNNLSINKIDNEAKSLLSKYNLNPNPNPSQAPIIRKDILINDHNYRIINAASKEIGYELEEGDLKGTKFKIYSYLLKERSQGSTDKIYANFLTKDNKIVGAYLHLDGYMPGVTSLTDRSSFMPEKLNHNNLQFEGVNKIILYGPSNKEFVGYMWKNKISIEKPSEIKFLTSLLHQSVLEKGNRSATYEDESYLILLHYDTGEIVRARLITYKNSLTTVITFDLAQFDKWHYTPSNELIEYIRKSLV